LVGHLLQVGVRVGERVQAFQAVRVARRVDQADHRGERERQHPREDPQPDAGHPEHPDEEHTEADHGAQVLVADQQEEQHATGNSGRARSRQRPTILPLRTSTSAVHTTRAIFASSDGCTCTGPR
jgi:hypothetical protein